MPSDELVPPKLDELAVPRGAETWLWEQSVLGSTGTCTTLHELMDMAPVVDWTSETECMAKYSGVACGWESTPVAGAAAGTESAVRKGADGVKSCPCGPAAADSASACG